MTLGNAVLIDNGGGLIYDTDLDITWYQHPNNTGDNGMNNGNYWPQALAWAEGLNLGGVTGWRLPSALNQDNSGPDLGWNVTGSEMGHLFYVELENKAWVDPETGLGNQQGWGLNNKGPFIELQPTIYFSSTITAPFTPGFTWTFNFGDGFQSQPANDTYYALAVHDGNVGASSVPEPPAILLLGLGLIGLAGLRRKLQQ